MPKHLLMKTELNEFFRLVQGEGLSPSDFRFKYMGAVLSGLDHPVTIDEIQYRQTGYSLRWGTWWKAGSQGAEARARVVLRPSENRASTEEDLGDWQSLLKAARRWLKCLKREEDSPDLWNSISQERALASVAGGQVPEESTLTVDERKQIVNGLRELREFLLATAATSDAQQALVTERLEYLSAASERLGKKDWLNLTLGVLTGIVINLSMDGLAARELLSLAGRLFRFLLPAVQLLP